MIIRDPAVAGKFYSASKEELHKEVSQYIIDHPKEFVIGIVSPHAGFIYSGHVAGEVYSRIEIPKTFIILGPNHTGMGEIISLMLKGKWEIPTGSFNIDEALAQKIYENSKGLISEDINAHLLEHSIEVQLPFIAYFSTDVKIVPITIMQASLEKCFQLAEAITKAIEEVDYKVTIIASSDMSHYVSDEQARKIDMEAIKRILALDPEGLYNIVIKKRISMCGYLPVTVMLKSALSMGATVAEMVKYSTSAEVSGDKDFVVGYVGIIIK